MRQPKSVFKSDKSASRSEKAVSAGVAIGAVAVVLSAAISMSGQGPTPTPAKSQPKKTVEPGAAAQNKAAAAPVTAWGQPDLQGTWFVKESIPLERSAANANKEYLTDEEVAAADKAKSADIGRNARSGDATADVTGAYNAVFNSVLRTGHRTSLVIDPPDGRIPPLVNGAQGRGGRGAGGGGARGGAGRGGADASDNPETVGQEPGGSGMVRCFGVLTPFMPDNTLFAQGTVMQIVQSPKSLGIYMEDDHSGGGTRIVYIDGRPHLPDSIKLYLGDSRGHWEGNILVIETTNFQEGYRGADPSAFKMTERLTRLDADTLRRDITFDDPKTWTRPWTVRIEMGRAPADKHMIFDSACHEGNYGMTGILVGARREEQKAAQGNK